MLPFICQAQDTLTKSSPVKVHGYVKDMQSAFFTNNAKSLVTGNFIHNRVNLKWNISDRLYLRAEVRNRLYYGEQVKTTPFFGKYVDRDNGLLHLSANVIEDTSIVLNTMLDRALLNWSNKKWDITIGRQRVNWGVNLVWNPNDIFNALNYFDFDYEERPGSDAIRVQYATGNFSSIELACKISDKGKEQVGAVMYKTNYKKYDLQQMAGIYFEDLVIGTGWAGNLMNNGFKGEVSYFHPYKKMMTHNGVLSGSVSIDRSFKNNYFAVLSYLYNSEGKGALHQMTELTGAVLSAKKLMPFKHSFFG
ncbi:MAG: hypothetical protein IT247_03730, partial [Bacteroidia bacterium]|nr:hypothetical protein [Bacteroidia bacterium]